MKIGVLLPAYNEEKNIQIVIKEARRYIKNAKILVIDDGSKDRTGELAKKAGAIVIRHKSNQGKGEALKTGFNFFLKSDVDAVLVADTDRQYRIKEAVKLIKTLKEEKADIVTGYRIPSQIPYANRLGNFGWRTLFNFFFGTNFVDTNCGFLVLTKKTMRKLKNIHGGYIIENSIFATVVKNNLKVKQVPVIVIYGKRRVGKFARMFFGVLIFIIIEGMKYQLTLK